MREVSEEVRSVGLCGFFLEYFFGDINGVICFGFRDSGLGCLLVGVGGYIVILLMLFGSFGGFWF